MKHPGFLKCKYVQAHLHAHTHTHRSDLLDPALMRPGRFDRKVRMPKPDTNGRYEILQLHLRKKQVVGVDVYCF